MNSKRQSANPRARVRGVLPGAQSDLAQSLLREQVEVDGEPFRVVAIAEDDPEVLVLRNASRMVTRVHVSALEIPERLVSYTNNPSEATTVRAARRLPYATTIYSPSSPSAHATQVSPVGHLLGTTPDGTEVRLVKKGAFHVLMAGEDVVAASRHLPSIKEAASELINAGYRANRSYSDEPDRDVWNQWRDLVNMTERELKAFRASAEGHQAGMSRAAARRINNKTGRESSSMLVKMIPTGGSFRRAVDSWKPEYWSWARRQISFIKRHRAQVEINDEALYDESGAPTRRLLGFLIWGHDPDRYDFGKTTPLLDAIR